MSNGSTKAYEVIADRIIAALDGGTIPWRKPWGISAGTRPQNVAGRPYSGVNAPILGLALLGPALAHVPQGARAGRERSQGREGNAHRVHEAIRAGR